MLVACGGHVVLIASVYFIVYVSVIVYYNLQSTPSHQRNTRSDENINAVRDNVQENPRQSIPRRAQGLSLVEFNVWT